MPQSSSTQRRGVVLERALHPDAEGRQHDRGFETLLVHDLQPGVAVAVLGVLLDRLQHPEGCAQVADTVLGSEEVSKAARSGEVGEGRVGDEAVDLPADEQPLLSVDLRPLHGPLAHLRVEMPGEGVGRFVVVVVRVEDRKVDHRHPYCSGGTGRDAGQGVRLGVPPHPPLYKLHTGYNRRPA
jgi:hypothetical protein